MCILSQGNSTDDNEDEIDGPRPKHAHRLLSVDSSYLGWDNDGTSGQA